MRELVLALTAVIAAVSAFLGALGLPAARADDGAVAAAPATAAAPVVLDAAEASAEAAGIAPAGIAPSASLTAPQTPAQRFGACLAGGGEADLLLLVDDSSSLLGTDPDAARVTSAGYFLDALAQNAERSGTPLEVGISTFGHAVQTVTPWTALTTASLPTLHAGLDQLRTRVDGFDTDYWTALEGARAELAAREAATPDTTRCQAVVLFSDGRLSISPRSGAEAAAYGASKPYAPGVDLSTSAGAEEATRLAREDLCRAGGLADQLGAAEIALFGIGLAPPGTPETEFDVLQSILTGKGSAGTSCGAPSSGARGEFALASDMDGLLFAFDAISNPGKPPLQQSAGVCAGAFCAEQAHRFVLDVATPQVRILATSDRPGLSASIRLPDSTPIEIPHAAPGTPVPFGVLGMIGQAVWKSEKTVAIEFAQGSMNLLLWQGQWQLALVDPTGQPGASKSNIHLSGALAPVWEQEGAAALRAGEVLGGQVFRIALAGGGAFDATRILGTMQFSGTIIDGRGEEHPIFATSDPAKVGRSERIDLSQAAVGEGRIVLRLDLATAPAVGPGGQRIEGTRLEPALVSIPVTILPPASYPVLAASAGFDAGDAAAGIAGRLELSGEGCAWVDPGAEATIEASPANLGRVRVEAAAATAADACHAAASGAPLELRLTAERPGTGTIRGTVPVSIGAADGSGEPIVVDVPFTAESQAPVGGLHLLAGFAAATLLGLGIPLGILALGGAWNARIGSRPAAIVRVPATLRGGRLTRGGAPFRLDPADRLAAAPLPGAPVRYLRLGEATLRARSSRIPGLAGHVRVEPGRGAHALPERLPGAIQGEWLAVRREDAAAGELDVFAIVRLADSDEALMALGERIAREAPERLAAWDAERRADGTSGERPAAAAPWRTSADAEPAMAATAPADSSAAVSAPASGFSPWRTSGAGSSAPAPTGGSSGAAMPPAPSAPPTIPGWNAPRR